jgi:hypothetical protein
MPNPIFQCCTACTHGTVPTKRQYVDRDGVSHDVWIDEDCRLCDGSGRIYVGEEPEPGSRT